MSTLSERIAMNAVRQRRNARLRLEQHLEWHRLFSEKRCPLGSDCPLVSDESSLVKAVS